MTYSEHEEDEENERVPAIFTLRPIGTIKQKRVIATNAPAKCQPDKHVAQLREWWHANMTDLQLSTSDAADAAEAADTLVEMWRGLAIDTRREFIAELLQAPGIDSVTASAVESAIFAVLNTTPHGTALFDTVFALMTFVRAHPHFSRIYEKTSERRPFGDATRYVLAEMGAPY